MTSATTGLYSRVDIDGPRTHETGSVHTQVAVGQRHVQRVLEGEGRFAGHADLRV